MEDILERGSQSEDSQVDVDQAFDLMIDVGEAVVNNSDLVQSMALSCPPPVATFLRFDDKVELDNPLFPDIWSLYEHVSKLLRIQVFFFSLDDQPYMSDNEEYVRVARKQVFRTVLINIFDESNNKSNRIMKWTRW